MNTTNTGINTFNAIAAIVGAVMTGFMLMFMFSTTTVVIYYSFGAIMIATNIYGLIQQKKSYGLLRGNILGIIAGSLHVLSGFLAIPAMILYILASVFIFKDKVK